jgi:hypothetical protein
MTEAWKSNKGEWSEAYTFLRLLVDPLVSAASYQLEAKPGKYYVAKGVRINSEAGLITFRPMAEVFRATATDEGVSSKEIKAALPKILEAISKGDGAFAIPLVQDLYTRIGLTRFKSASANKVDIELELPSLGGGQDASLGFSIKSMLGKASTLFNASQVTNIDYLLTSDFHPLEDLKTLKYHELRPYVQSGSAEFLDCAASTFKDNLEFFGSDFPKKLAGLVLTAYLVPGVTKLEESVSIWASDSGDQFAEAKLIFQLKSFLRASALGMKPSEPWSGDLEGYGGYIVVKPDGDLVCLHLENDDDFRSYLFNFTRFDFPKSELFKKSEVVGDKLQFSLNFQIRFIR